MDTDNDDIINDVSQGTDMQGGKDLAKSGAKKGANAAGNAMKKRVSSAGKKAVKEGVKAGAKAGATAAKSGGIIAKLGALFGTPVGWVILAIIAIIILIMLIIGGLSFFLTMPGIIREKLDAFVTSAWKSFSGFFAGNVSQQVNKKDEIELAQYIEELGYNIDTYGFGHTVREENENGDMVITDLYYDPPEKNDGEEDDVKRTYNTGKTVDYLKQYLAANEATYMKRGFSLSRFFTNLNDKSNWGEGMLWFRKKAGNVEIDREKKIMTITQNVIGPLKWGSKFQYNMDGWTGRYGKPLEFSLALHLSTMSPDLVYELITHPAFNTKMHIGMQEVRLDIELKYVVDGVAYSRSDIEKWIKEKDYTYLDEEELKALEKFMKDNGDTAKTYIPYIIAVEKSWYYGLMEFEYLETDMTGRYKKYAFSGSVPEELSGIEDSLIVTETIKGKYLVQVAEPTVRKPTPNEAIKALFKGGSGTRDSGIGVIYKGPNSDTEINIKAVEFDFPGEYYRYDGTYETADAIRQARGGENKSTSHSDKKVEKQPIGFEKESAFQAFSILEGMKTLDSEYIYRDLKNLLVELEFFKKEDFNPPETSVLDWILEDWKPEMWPMKDPNLYGAIIRGKTASPEKGFDSGKTVITPGPGIVQRIDGNSVTIKLSGDAGQDMVKDMTIKISNINVSVVEGSQLYKGQAIGTTTGENINIIMRDKKNAILDDVDDYMNPPSVDTNKIGEGLKEGELPPNIDPDYNPPGGDSGTDIDDENTGETSAKKDYNVYTLNSDENIVSIDEFKSIFKAYPKLVQNAEYFMEIQRAPYYVNAVFAACVSITECGAGSSYPDGVYNIFGIMSGGKLIEYTSYEQAIKAFASTIKNTYFDYGCYTVSQIGARPNYNYCTPPEPWIEAVNGRMYNIFK